MRFWWVGTDAAARMVQMVLLLLMLLRRTSSKCSHWFAALPRTLFCRLAWSIPWPHSFSLYGKSTSLLSAESGARRLSLASRTSARYIEGFDPIIWTYNSLSRADQSKWQCLCLELGISSGRQWRPSHVGKYGRSNWTILRANGKCWKDARNCGC